MTDVATLQQTGPIATVQLAAAAVTAAARTALAAALDRFAADDGLAGLAILFADEVGDDGAIEAENDDGMAPGLAALIDRIEGSDRPVIAVLPGPTRAGDLQLALACHARIAGSGARLGFPEIRFGRIAGTGGTARLPRLAGLALALKLAVEGKPVGAGEALAAGLIDRIADGAIDRAATAFAAEIAADDHPPRRARDLPAPAADPALIDAAEQGARKRQRGQSAPLLAIAAIRFGLGHDLDAALAEEDRLAREAAGSAQARALTHIAAAEHLVAHPPGIDLATPVRPVARVAVIGLGTMGRGIVTALASAGLEVVAIARDAAGLAKAQAAIDKAWGQAETRGQLSPAARAARVARLRWSDDMAIAAEADLIVESIREAPGAKLELFTALGRIAKPGAILASNTSYLDIDALAAASGRPADVCGLHFFNPADVMKLAECVQGAATAPDVVATAMALATRLGKVGVVSGVCDGFIVNRLLAKRSREAYFLLEEGATPWAIDRVLVDFGFPMGPFALGDLAGIDVQHAARQARADRLTPRERRADFVDQLFAAGRLGRRSGAGWYAYGEDGKARPDPAIEALVASHGDAHAIARRDIADAEIHDRLLFAMVNEGARLIDEGIVARPHEIDVAMVNGIGFPRHLGGPLWWAESLGLAAVAARVGQFRAEQGETYWPASPTLEAGHFYRS
jgi:3-hydroxyacyl-CoA dehydrogenase